MNFFTFFAEVRSKLIFVSLILLLAVSIGVGGYMIIEGYTFIEAFYMTIITISTVGFGEVDELSTTGRLFTIFLILTNLGVFTYGVGVVTSLFLGGNLNTKYKKFLMLKTIEKMDRHVIICGYGNTGKEASRLLKRQGLDFIVIENDESTFETLSGETVPHLNADARDDNSLISAGIEKAQAIICTLPYDSDNLFIVVSARSMNSEIKIVSKAAKIESESKLLRAGANHIIMPDKIGGAHMARLVYSPDAYAFLDKLEGQAALPVHFMEINFNDVTSELQDRTLEEMNCRQRTGATIVGMKVIGGDYIINPEPNEVFSYDKKLVILGNADQIAAFNKVFAK